MAKVASRSWFEAAKEFHPVHCHYVVPENRQRIEAVFLLPPAQQTIANMLMPRNLLRVGASAWRQIESARRNGERIRVISGMRDPVARSISLIVFMADFHGHVSRPLSPHVEMSPEYIVGALQENWRSVLERDEPRQTFEWLLWYLTNGFRIWFTEELGAVFEVDVLEGECNARAGAQRVSASGAEILLYRVEDMLPSASGYAGLLAQASSFLETPVTAFPNINSSATRRSRALSEEVRRQFWLPDDMLDAIYAEPAVRHFYTRDETVAFKKRWRARLDRVE